MFKRLLRYMALHHGRGVSFYRKFGKPSAREWADYLREQGGVYHIGEDCAILPSARILDPAYTWIGNRVILGSCTLIAHDGSIQMLEQAYGVKIDRIGAIRIEDDVFVGEGVIVAAANGITVGRGSIIGAGSVVRENVPPESVVIGNPAKVVAKVGDLLRFWEADTLSFPWSDLILKRQRAFDAELEPELIRMRQMHFFGRTRH